MQFVYSQTIWRATDIDYSREEVLQWLKDNTSDNNWLDILGEDDYTANSIVSYIFDMADWVPQFVDDFELPEVFADEYSSELSEQVKELCGDELEEYYEEVIDENPIEET